MASTDHVVVDCKAKRVHVYTVTCSGMPVNLHHYDWEELEAKLTEYVAVETPLLKFHPSSRTMQIALKQRESDSEVRRIIQEHIASRCCP